MVINTESRYFSERFYMAHIMFFGIIRLTVNLLTQSVWWDGLYGILVVALVVAWTNMPKFKKEKELTTALLKQYLLKMVLIFIAYDVYSHLDQIIIGWNRAGSAPF